MNLDAMLISPPMPPPPPEPPWLLRYILKAIWPASAMADSLLEPAETLPCEDCWSKSYAKDDKNTLQPPSLVTWLGERVCSVNWSRLTLLASDMAMPMNWLWLCDPPPPPPPENLLSACIAAAEPMPRSSAGLPSSWPPKYFWCCRTASAGVPSCQRCRPNLSPGSEEDAL